MEQSGSGREITRGIEAGEVVNALSLEQLGSISCIGKRRQLLASAGVLSCLPVFLFMYLQTRKLQQQ